MGLWAGATWVPPTQQACVVVPKSLLTSTIHRAQACRHIGSSLGATGAVLGGLTIKPLQAFSNKFLLLRSAGSTPSCRRRRPLSPSPLPLLQHHAGSRRLHHHGPLALLFLLAGLKHTRSHCCCRCSSKCRLLLLLLLLLLRHSSSQLQHKPSREPGSCSNLLLRLLPGSLATN